MSSQIKLIFQWQINFVGIDGFSSDENTELPTKFYNFVDETVLHRYFAYTDKKYFNS